MTGLKDTFRLFGAAAFLGMISFGAHSMTEAAIRKDGRAGCQPVEVSVYFAPGATELNGFAESVLNNAMYRVGKCEIAQIDVFGFADATGSPDVNQKISEQRAQAALDFLVAKGVNAEQVNLAALGDDGARDTNGKPLVMRRKADLRIVPVKDAEA